MNILDNRVHLYSVAPNPQRGHPKGERYGEHSVERRHQRHL